MKKFRNQIITLSIGILIGTTGVAFAATNKSPAPAMEMPIIEAKAPVAEEPEIIKEISVADDADFETFHDEMHESMKEQRKSILNKKVKEGFITKEKAEYITERMDEHHYGNSRRGMRNGRGMGRGMMGRGFGYGCH